MLLTDALFEHVSSTLRGDSAAAPGPVAPAPEQRREPRVGVRAQVTIIPISDRLQIAPFEVPVRDLSAGGIGFVHTTKMSLDDQFVVLLPSAAGESVPVLCQVAHYQPLAEQAFAVGARFVRVLRQPGSAAGGATTPFPTRTAGSLRAAS